MTKACVVTFGITFLLIAFPGMLLLVFSNTPYSIYCSVTNDTLSGVCQDRYMTVSFEHQDTNSVQCYCYHHNLYIDSPPLNKKDYRIRVSGLVLSFGGICLFFTFLCFDTFANTNRNCHIMWIFDRCSKRRHYEPFTDL